jgi:hypothetical protein
MPRWPGPSRYHPLTRYLAGLTADEVTLTFAEIEAIIGAPLPAAARVRSWWANTRAFGQGRAWLGASWRVARASLRPVPPTVTFARVRSDTTA